MSFLGTLAVKTVGSAIGKAVLKEVAPGVLGSLKGKSEALDTIAPVIATVARSRLNLPADPSTDDVQEALRADPAAGSQLREIAERQAETQVELVELRNKDRDSARRLQIATRDPIVRKLALHSQIFSYVAFASLVGLIIVAPDLPPELLTILAAVIGYVFAEKQQATGFYFGAADQPAGENRDQK